MDVKELESKTVAELKEIAKELGISGISAMKKADLIAAIAGASDAPAPETASEPAPEVEVAPEVEAAPESEPEPEAEAAPEEEAPGPAESGIEAAPEPEPEPEVEAAPEEEAPVEEPAMDAAPEEEASGPAESGTEEPAMEAAPETEPEPEVEAAPERKKAAPAPEPEPKVKEIVLTKAQTRLRAKHDLPALKLEKRALQSQILAAIAAKDSAKMKELRGRKKEIRRLLNRV